MYLCSSAGSVELSKVLLRGWVDVDVLGKMFVPVEERRGKMGMKKGQSYIYMYTQRREGGR